MPENKKNIIVFYHEDCLDGFASAYIAHKKFKNKADYFPLSQTSGGKDILKNKKHKISDLKDKEVYFIDFCLRQEELAKVLKVAKKVVVLDHHISAKEIVEDLYGSVYGEGISGAYLASQYFFPKLEVSKFIRYISAGDTYNFGKQKFEKEILAYLRTLEFEYADFTKAEKDLQDKKRFLEIKNIGEILNRNYLKLVKQQLQKAKLIDLEGHKVYAINASSVFTNELGHQLAEKSKSKFAVVYHMDEGELKVSLRGLDKTNLSELAGKFAGGGHFNASAFKIKDKLKIRNFLEKVLN